MPFNILDLGIKASQNSGPVIPSMRFTIVTTTPDESFQLPVRAYQLTVNWGDGSGDFDINDHAGDSNHIYSVPGTYEISLRGICDSFGGGWGGNTQIKELLEVIDLGFTYISFNGCSNLIAIPASLSSLTHLTDATGMFYACTSLAEIPTGIFDNCPDITSFNTAFQGCSNISSLPEHLFDFNINVTNFDNCFRECTSLVSIPDDFFKFNTLVTNFNGTFVTCRALSAIPTDLFRYNTLAIGFSGIFAQTAITAIPTDLFRYNINAANMSYMFQDCQGLTGVPENLFDYNTLVTDLSWVFASCSNIASYPVDLFKFNTLVTTFSGIFCYGRALATLPADIFRYNILVTDFSWAFRDSTWTTMPDDLFRYNTLATNFAWCFQENIYLKFKSNIFYRTGEQSTRFLNQSVDFTNCFEFANNFGYLASAGEAPDLWNCDFGTGTPTKTKCFANGGNTPLRFSNFSDIPLDWDGVEEVDYMEYSTDSSIRSAYIGNETELSRISQTQDAFGAILGRLGTNQYRQAQGFKVSTGDLIVTAIEVKQRADGAGSPTGNWTLRIETDNAGVPSGTLADANASIVVVPPGPDAVVKGTFAAPFSLTPGTQYHLVMVCDTQASGVYWSIAYKDTDAYTDGDRSSSNDGGSTWTDPGDNSDLYFKVYTKSFQCYSESTIIAGGSYSFKGIAAITDSLNKTFTKTISSMDLSGKNLYFEARSNRSGQNIKLSIKNSGGLTTEFTPQLNNPDLFETHFWDLSAVSDSDKNAITEIKIEIVNADSDNTFYIDSIRATLI